MVDRKPYKQKLPKKPFKIYTVWQNCPTSILFDWALHSCMFFHFFLLLQNWRGQPFTVCQVIKRHLLPQVNLKHWEEIRIRYLELLFQFGSYWHWLYYIIKPQAANGNSTGSAQNHLEPLFSSARTPPQDSSLPWCLSGNYGRPYWGPGCVHFFNFHR